MQDLYTRSCRLYGSHPATRARSHRSGKRSALKDLNHYVGIDDLVRCVDTSDGDLVSYRMSSQRCTCMCSASRPVLLGRRTRPPVDESLLAVDFDACYGGGAPIVYQATHLRRSISTLRKQKCATRWPRYLTIILSVRSKQQLALY